MKVKGRRLLFLLGLLFLVAGCGEVARLGPGTAALKVAPQEGVATLRVRVYDAAKLGLHAVFEAAPGSVFGVDLDGLNGEGSVEITGETRTGFALHRWKGDIRAGSTVRYVEFDATTRLMITLGLVFVHVPAGVTSGILYVYAYPVSGALTVAGPKLGGAPPVALKVLPVSEGGTEQLDVPLSPIYTVVLEANTGTTYTWAFDGQAAWITGSGEVVLDFAKAGVK